MDENNLKKILVKDIYDYLVSNESLDIKYEYVTLVPERRSIKMRARNNPWSITRDEFIFINKYIKSHGLKNAYEICTGFGISSLSIGLGIKSNKGKLGTIDAYIEEHYQNDKAYAGDIRPVYNNVGFNSVSQLINLFLLEDTIFPKIGISPEDVGKHVETIFKDDQLDFVFIDGLHIEKQAIKDFNAVLPFLNKERYAIFFHDGMLRIKNLAEIVKNELPDCNIYNNMNNIGNNFWMSLATNISNEL